MSDSLKSLQDEIARLVVDSLNLEDIDPGAIDYRAPLFGEGLGLDSIDALEIGAAISKHYKIKFSPKSEDNAGHFNSIESLAKFVAASTRSGDD